MPASHPPGGSPEAGFPWCLTPDCSGLLGDVVGADPAPADRTLALERDPLPGGATVGIPPAPGHLPDALGAPDLLDRHRVRPWVRISGRRALGRGDERRKHLAPELVDVRAGERRGTCRCSSRSSPEAWRVTRPASTSALASISLACQPSAQNQACSASRRYRRLAGRAPRVPCSPYRPLAPTDKHSRCGWTTGPARRPGSAGQRSGKPPHRRLSTFRFVQLCCRHLRVL